MLIRPASSGADFLRSPVTVKTLSTWGYSLVSTTGGRLLEIFRGRVERSLVVVKGPFGLVGVPPHPYGKSWLGCCLGCSPGCVLLVAWDGFPGGVCGCFGNWLTCRLLLVLCCCRLVLFLAPI